MKTWLGGALLACAYLPLGAATRFVDGVAAEAVGNPILYSAVVRRAGDDLPPMVSSFPQPQKASAYARALADMINLILIKDHAISLEIEVTDEDVTAQVEHVCHNNHFDLNQLEGILRSQGKTLAAYREDLRDQMLVQRFQGRVLLPRIAITDQDVADAFRRETGTSGQMERLRFTLYRLPPAAAEATDPVRERHHQQAREVAAALRIGTPVERLQDSYSLVLQQVEATSEELAQHLIAALRDLEPGGFSEVTEVEGGRWAILRLESRSVETSEALLKNRDRITLQLRMDTVRSELERWLATRRNTANIRIHIPEPDQVPQPLAPL